MENLTKMFINDLETSERDRLIKKNKKLIEQLQNDLYENNLELQYIEAQNIINDEGFKAIQYHDNYNSFFYTLLDWRKFIENIDKNYIDDIETYNKIMKNIEKMDKMEEYNEEYYKIDEENEKLTKNILEGIEAYLHGFEEYPSEDDAIQYADEMEQLNDLYIEEIDGFRDGVIRQDIAYTKTFI